MSNRLIASLIAFWLLSLTIVLLSFAHPTYTWTPEEVARDRVILH